MNLDSYGIQGMALHYATVLLFFGTALLIFFYLWWKNRLDMDESPKLQMFRDEDNNG
ncbi:hypothetical protein PHSC3_000833 [Chlamydiales bacterium STE3]|nr:hypothetical protein PHSC3_000833 [Chlamydiales bacterium STE3]